LQRLRTSLDPGAGARAKTLTVVGAAVPRQGAVQKSGGPGRVVGPGRCGSIEGRSGRGRPLPSRGGAMRTLLRVSLVLAVLAAAQAAARGEEVLNTTGELKKDDPKDRRTKQPSRVHEVKLAAGKTYTIDLKSKQ